MIDIFAELDKKFNIVEKTNNLSNYLLNDRYFPIGNIMKTFYGALKDAFHGWPLNNNYENLEDMLSNLSFAKVTGPSYDRKVSFILNDEESCYAFLQFVKNAAEYLKYRYQNSSVYIEFDAVLNKIYLITSKANIKFIYDNEKKYYKLVELKPLLREIAQTTNKDCAYLLYDYSAIENNDNLEKKKVILATLGTYTEPITKAYTKKSGDIYDLYDNLDFALNNFNIRHNNLEGPKKKDYIVNLTDKERLELYDYTYDLILAVLSQSNSQPSLNKVIDIKKKFKLLP